MIGRGGVFKETVDGKDVYFHFGVLSAVHTEEKTGLVISDVFKKITSAKILLAYFWGGAVAYNEINGIKEEVTVANVSVWMDSIGALRLYEIYSQSIQSPASKNGKAPKEAEPVA
jgi:hypothetical protein